MLSGLNAMTDILLLANKRSAACFTSWQDLQCLHFKLDFTQDNVSEQLNYFQEILYCLRIFVTWHESKCIQSWDRRNYKYQMCICVSQWVTFKGITESKAIYNVCKIRFPINSWVMVKHNPALVHFLSIRDEKYFRELVKTLWSEMLFCQN